MKRALFIDRDGIINRMVKYPNGWDSPQKPQDVKLVFGVEKVILWANKNGIPVVEISNQPGVAKGKMSKKISRDINKKLYLLLKDKGVYIDKAYICYHHSEAIIKELKVCDCRKPKPGLLFKAARELKIDLSKSIFLGDKVTDVKAGRDAGCKTIIFIHNKDKRSKVEEAKRANADYKIFELSETISIAEAIYLK